MAGGDKNIHNHPKAGSGDFRANPQNINRSGSKPSIKIALQKLMDEDGKMKIPAKSVVTKHENGDITIMLPRKQQMAMKIVQWAMGNKGSDSLKALELAMKYLEDQESTINVRTENDLDKASTETLLKLKEEIGSKL